MSGTDSTSTNPIENFSALMDHANAAWRLYDLGRKITKISKDEFSAIEENRAPYPYPVQQKARFALVFWDHNNQKQGQDISPFIWFLQFDLDELGFLKLQQRDHYISLVVKALGSNLVHGDSEQSELKNHPYRFTPDQNRLAAFNAIVKKALKQPASIYFEHVESYFAGQIDDDKWQELSIQGVADYTVRLDELSHQRDFINKLPNLPIQTLSIITAVMEHLTINLTLTDVMIDLLKQKLSERDYEASLYLLRGVSSSDSSERIRGLLTELLNSELVGNETFYIVIAGRFWKALSDPMLLSLYLQRLAEHQEQTLFNGLFSDLVSIPSLRADLLNLIRSPNRPEAIGRAIEAIFRQREASVS